MVAISTATGLYNVAVNSHEHGRTDMPYMKLRNKPYPWSCSDCNIFDGDCWAACKGKGKAKKEAHAH
jgi:hypothetical protein